MEDLDYKQAAAELEKLALSLGLTATWQFVPFSQSRNAKGNSDFKGPNINWRYTLLCKGREVLAGDYMLGVGHIPHKVARGSDRKKVWFDEYQKSVCETGKYIRHPSYENSDHVFAIRVKLDPPSIADLLHSLCLDSDVLNYGDFEEWASVLGFDTDSRKAESIYRACVETALKLQSCLGAETLAEMRELTNQM